MYKKKLMLCIKIIKTLRKTRFFFETSDTKTCDNQKKLFDYSQFLFDLRVGNYKPQRVDKKNQSDDNIFEFCNCHKIFLYKKIKLFIIKKSEYDV